MFGIPLEKFLIKRKFLYFQSSLMCFFLPGLSPDRDIDFNIDVEQGIQLATQLVSIFTLSDGSN